MSSYQQQELPVIRYLGNGLNKTFNIPFDFRVAADITVYVNLEKQSQPFNYSVKADNVVLQVAPSQNVSVVIMRTSECERLTNFQNYAIFDEKYIDLEFDNFLRLIEENRHIVSNAIHAPQSEWGAWDGAIKQFGADKILQISPDGTGVVALSAEESVLGELFVLYLAQTKKARDEAREALADTKVVKSQTEDVLADTREVFNQTEDVRDATKVIEQQALAHAQDSEASADNAETNYVATELARADLMDIPHRTLCFMKEAQRAASGLIKNGEIFTPTLAIPYPTIATETLWLINLTAPFTFTTGALSGQTVKSQDMLYCGKDSGFIIVQRG